MIFAVDDDPSVRRSIERTLRSEGYRTRSCDSAESGMRALAKEQPPALLLLDVSMPGESGFDLARRIRAGELGDAHRDVPIMFLTAETHEGAYEQSFDVGAHRYLCKPYETELLLNAISALLHE
jgi:DNA-binding response OmpR family regulator